MRTHLLIPLLLMLPVIQSIALADTVSPVLGGRLTSLPGWRLDPFGSGKRIYHRGYDIGIPVGTPVKPTQNGVVYYAGAYKGYGWLVAVAHDNGYVTMYGHLSRILLPIGTKVDTDSVIALSGNTGRSTGPHLHYEIRQWPGARENQSPPEMKNATPSNHDDDKAWVEETLGVVAAGNSNILRENEWTKGM